ncbi:MAG: glycosyl hydrolase family 18 protein [Bacteroidota bacterium]
MKNLLLLVMALLSLHLFSQQYPSIHQQQLEENNLSGEIEAGFYENLPAKPAPTFEKVNCNLNKVVYGWHPYWVGSAYTNYQWDLLSHFSFFSYEVDAATGNANSTHGWATSAAVTEALTHDVKVTLCVTLFSNHTTFFASPTSQQTLITNLINLVQSRGAHGVNIDFEGIPNSQKTNFANFMVNLSNQMHTAIPNSEVSTVLYAVDWNDVFDFSIMEPAVDQYIVMGYAYYYNGSSTAGPCDPLYQFGNSYNYTLSRSTTYYLDKGCPRDKLVMGLPYYGYEWETTLSTIPSPTAANGVAKTYDQVKTNTSGNYSTANHIWVNDAQTDAYSFNDGAQKQCFITMEDGFAERLKHINRSGIAGIGIWALGYDDGHNELWDAIEENLTDCYSDPCSGTIHDFGGPLKNYYNDENYTWTIEPQGATSIDVNFSAFNVEANYDYLYIYDGNSTSAPQIAGSPFSGTNSPGQFSSSTGALTFRFTSDGATVTSGFLATYQCGTIPEPIAGFSFPSNSICLGDSILLNNTSTDADSYQWSISGGGLSSATAENPYWFVNNSAQYTVQLIVSNISGADTLSQVVNLNVLQQPIAIASAVENEITIPTQTASFNNASINATTYAWNFGDGTSSTDQFPTHDYSAPGVYDVELIVSNGVCENDTTTIQITVGQLGLMEQSVDLQVYPNPADETVQITSTNGIQKYVLLDQLGRQVASRTTDHVNEVIIDVTNYAQGIYLLNLTFENGDTVVRQVIKK